MKRTISLLAAAGALALGPTIASAAPTPPSPTTAPGNGQYNGTGYDHTNSGNANGQPNQSCEESVTTPGNSASAPGGGSPFGGDTSTAGTHYAGSQLQNSRNTASVSQYDVACSNQPQ